MMNAISRIKFDSTLPSALSTEGPITIRVLSLDGSVDEFMQESWGVPQDDGSMKLLPLDRG